MRIRRRCTRRSCCRLDRRTSRDYDNPQVTSLLDQARGTADADQRAKLTSQAQAIITNDMVWIPLALPSTTVVMHKGITGVPSTFQYQFGPWGVYLGAN